MIDYTHRHTWIHLDTQTQTDTHGHASKREYTDRHKFISDLGKHVVGDGWGAVHD